MNDAALIFRLWKCCLDRFTDPGQPVSADDQNVFNSAVLKAVQDGQPVLGTLVIADFDRENIFLSLTAESQNDVSRHLPDDPIVPDGIVDRIDVEDGIDVVEGPVLPVLNLRQDFVCHIGNEAFRGLKAIDIHERVGDLPGGHPLGVHGDDLLVDVRDVLLALFDDLWLEGGLAVLRDIDPHGAVAGVDGLFLVAVAVVVGI